MKSLIPSSLRKGVRASIAIAAAALVALGGSNAFAKHSEAKRQIKEYISFDLTAATGSSTTAEGEAKIQVAEKCSKETAKVEVEVKGLDAGTYAVNATLEDSTTIHLGDLTVQAASKKKAKTRGKRFTAKHHHGRGDDDDDHKGDCDNNDDDGDNDNGEDKICGKKAKLKVTLPSTVDASAITTVTVSTSTNSSATTSTVVLTGDVNSESAKIRYFAAVPVTAAPTSALTDTPSAADDTSSEIKKGKAKGKRSKVSTTSVRGLVLASTTITGGETTKHCFVLLASGAPSNATLNIVVNGETVGTVTSNKCGFIKFRDLPETVDLTSLDLVTVTDANGVAVMQADF